MKLRLLFLFRTLSLFQADATVISGKISDLTGQPLSSNRLVIFTLQNCGNNIPVVMGSSVIVPATKTVFPNAAGSLTGSLVGNDMISCGPTIGQTFYKTAIYAAPRRSTRRRTGSPGPPAWWLPMKFFKGHPAGALRLSPIGSTRP